MNLDKIAAQGGIALVIDETNVNELKGMIENVLGK
jgi:hypothetical protein